MAVPFPIFCPMSEIRVKKSYPNICTLMPYDLFELQIKNKNEDEEVEKWRAMILTDFFFSPYFLAQSRSSIFHIYMNLSFFIIIIFFLFDL